MPWIIPTLHPAFLLRGQMQFRDAVVSDLSKARRFALGKGSTWDESGVITDPDLLRVLRWTTAARRVKSEVAVDIETDGEHPMKAQITDIALSRTPNLVISIPMRESDWSAVAHRMIRTALQSLLADPAVPKIFQFGQFDQLVLEQNGFSIQNYAFDTFVAHHAVRSEEPHRLEYLTSFYTDSPFYKEEVKGQGGVLVVTDKVRRLYNARDALATLVCAKPIRQEVKERQLDRLVEHDMAIRQMCVEMNRQGVLVDTERLRQFQSQYTAEREAALRDVLQFAKINPGSPPQVGEALRKRFGASSHKRTPTGKMRVQAGDLQDMSETLNSDGKAFIFSVLRWRRAAKLLSTYLEGLELIDGRIYPSFSQIPVTGRLNCENPNLQNQPPATRSIFVPAPGHVFIKLDYSQLEVRLAAYLSGDEALCRAFAEGKNIHAANAALLFDLTYDEVLKLPPEKRERLRLVAKKFVFGMSYGAQAETLWGALRKEAWKPEVEETERAALLELKLSDIEALLLKWWETHPGHAAYRRQLLADAAEGVLPRTFLLNRPRAFLRDREYGSVGETLGLPKATEVLNYPIQGGAADVVGTAMLRVRGLAPLWAQVHDDLNFEVEEDKAESVAAMVKARMEEPVGPWSFPVDVKILRRWE